MSILIGVAGRAQNGKTETANAIEQRAIDKGLVVQTYDIGKLVLGFCVSSGLLPSKRRQDLNAEELDTLVRTGKAQRDKDPSYWIRQVEQQYYKDKPDVGLIPNLRCYNEVEAVKRARGVTVLVTCLNANGSHYISPDRDANHPLETELLGLNADFKLEVKRGQSALLSEQAITLFEYIWSLEEQRLPYPEEINPVEVEFYT